MKLDNLKELQTRMKSIRKELIYNYDYSYFDANLAGLKEGTIVPNENLNERFGPSRKGYELFKDEYDELRVGYSGVLSLREITLNESLVGYIVESKRPTRPYIKEADDIYDEVLEEFKEILGVEDEKALEYYINENGPCYDFDKDSVTLQSQKVSFLVDLINEYNDDEDFKHFFDKIIK